jgi:hypothetical protein
MFDRFVQRCCAILQQSQLRLRCLPSQLPGATVQQ